MPGPLAYTAIALMARDRVRQIRIALQARKATARSSNDIELQLLYLAQRTYDFMSAGRPSVPSPLRLYGPPLGDEVSQFLLMGGVGPEIPAYSALFARGQAWVRDTLHKGTADADKEQVLVHSTDFVLDFWTRVQPMINQEFSHDKDKTNALASVRAYLLGHLCHIAADVICTPYVNDIEWHAASGTQPKLTHQQVIGAIEARVATDIFGRNFRTRGDDWGNWWPAPGKIPASLFKAYKETLEHYFGTGARQKGASADQQRRQKGLGGYEEQRGKDSPPELDEDLLKDGYATFRTVAQTGVAWDLLDWMSATWPLFVMPLAALPIMNALHQGGQLFQTPPPSDLQRDVAFYEAFVLPFAVTSLTPLIASVCLTFSYLGARSEIIVGWISGLVQFVAGIIFLATAKSIENDGQIGPAPWVLLFFLPLAIEIFHIVYTLSGSNRNPRRWQLAMSSILHIGLSLAFFLFYFAFLHNAVEKLRKDGVGSGDFWGLLLAWSAILAALWFLTSLALRYLVTDRVPSDVTSDFVTKRSHSIRLLDDTTLFRQPAGTSPTLSDLYYPSGRRRLLKIWWDGSGAKIQCLGDRLVFTFGATVRTIHAPLAPTKASEFAEYLQRVVKDGTGQAKLKAKLYYPDDLDYEFPSGTVFSDQSGDNVPEGDPPGPPSPAVDLKQTEGEAFVLYHASKAAFAVRFNTTGPEIDPEDRTVAVPGNGNLSTVGANPLQLVAGGANPTPLTKLFRPGDLVVSGAASRMIVSVDNETQITIATAFPVPLAAAAYSRGVPKRHEDFPAPGGTVNSHNFMPNDLVGNGTTFGQMFIPGDIIRVNTVPPQERIVITVVSDTLLTISQPLNPPVAAAAPGVAFTRVAEPIETNKFMAGPDDTLTSADTVMDQAADFAALLCLAGTSQLLCDQELDKTKVGSSNNLLRVYQVFRNWNLDRRRENEWKMIVLGGAVSEKRGDATALDPALHALPSTWSLLSGRGEPVSNRFGWLPLFRRWVEMAGRPAEDTKDTKAFRPGGPPNLDLSRALAYLFDMRDPVP